MGAGRLGDDASTDLTNDRLDGDRLVFGKHRAEAWEGLGRTCGQASSAVPAGFNTNRVPSRKGSSVAAQAGRAAHHDGMMRLFFPRCD
jgi:hypothetical protein